MSRKRARKKLLKEETLAACPWEKRGSVVTTQLPGKPSGLLVYLKLVLVLCPPLCALFLVSALSLQQASNSIERGKQTRRSLNTAMSMQELVTDLQKERGMSCLYLTASKLVQCSYQCAWIRYCA